MLGLMTKRQIPWALALPNLALLALFPVSWFAPLMSARILPLFGAEQISVISGLQALWESDVVLALLVTFFAILAPYLKTIGLALIHIRLMSPRVLGALHILGKLAMADIFLIALYIVVSKGIGIGKIETEWGLYLFTACILASIAISLMTERHRKSGSDAAPSSLQKYPGGGPPGPGAEPPSTA